MEGIGREQCVNVAHKGIVRPVISLTEALVVNKWKGRSTRHVKAMHGDDYLYETITRYD